VEPGQLAGTALEIAFTRKSARASTGEALAHHWVTLGTTLGDTSVLHGQETLGTAGTALGDALGPPLGPALGDTGSTTSTRYNKWAMSSDCWEKR
jgi:hypothetical protein